MTLNAKQSILLIVDLQERLLPAIDGGQAIINQTAWLIGVARELGVPVIATEQYPLGLGSSAPQIADLLLPGELVEKTHFSAVAEGNLLSHPHGNRLQWVVCGTESHVCVQQTVLDLLAAGRQVAVVEEAVGSRKPGDTALALQRMRQHGADIVSREMVAFEWLGKANTPEFRTVLKDFIR
jgi:nicotinamidase-related amidase